VYCCVVASSLRLLLPAVTVCSMSSTGTPLHSSLFMWRLALLDATAKSTPAGSGNAARPTPARPV
jgi:hypothetical protein